VLSLPPDSRLPGTHRVSVRGYLERPPPLSNGSSTSRPGWRLYSKSAHFVEALPSRAPGAWVHGVSAWMRDRVELALNGSGTIDSPGVHLIRALVLGQSWTLPTSWRRGLQASGLSHLVALSGLHVGLLAGLILALSSGLRARIRIGLLVLLVPGYLFFVGPRPALMRACAMLLSLCLAAALRRPPLPGNTLVAVAAAMLAAEPALITDLGFRLTFSATAGILVLSPRLEGRWRRLPTWLKGPLSVTVGAQLGTVPWAVPAFHLLTPLSPLWNLLALPWTGVALGWGVLWACLAIASPGAATCALPLADLLALPFVGVASLPPTVTRPWIVDWNFLETTFASVLLFGVLTRRLRWLALAGLVALTAGAGGQLPNDAAEMIVFDVGQGESILLRDSSHGVLVDGGGWRRADIGSRVLLPALASQGVHALDALVVSHPDLDHCGGLVQIASFFPVREVWSAPGWKAEGCVADLITLPGVEIHPLWAGESRTVGLWNLQVLNPSPGARGGQNDHSLVLLGTAGGRRFLLTGDIEASAEARLLQAYPEELGDVDVLKLAHHGSRTSSTVEWLDRTDPSLAVVSAGLDNRYGHPSPTVVGRLAERRIRLLRSDLQGLIRLRVQPPGVLRINLPGSPKPPS
jgi:competence protein ComEC